MKIKGSGRAQYDLMIAFLKELSRASAESHVKIIAMLGLKVRCRYSFIDRERARLSLIDSIADKVMQSDDVVAASEMARALVRDDANFEKIQSIMRAAATKQARELIDFRFFSIERPGVGDGACDGRGQDDDGDGEGGGDWTDLSFLVIA